MPLARTHDLIGGIAALIVFPASTLLIQRYSLVGVETALRDGAIITGAHVFGTFLLSPDLDTDSAIDNRWGIFKAIWLPYTLVVPHRAIWSHSGLSGLLRVLYLAVMIMGLLWALSGALVLMGVSDPGYHRLFVNWLQQAVFDHPRIAALIAVGIVFSDLLHTIADHLSTEGKRLRRQMGFGRRRRRA